MEREDKLNELPNAWWFSFQELCLVISHLKSFSVVILNKHTLPMQRQPKGIGMTFFARGPVFVQAVVTPTPCVKEICRFITPVGLSL